MQQIIVGNIISFAAAVMLFYDAARLTPGKSTDTRLQKTEYSVCHLWCLDPIRGW